MGFRMDTAAIVAIAIGLVGALAIPLRRMLKSDSSATPASNGSDDNGDSDEKPKAATSNIESIREDLKSIRADLGSYGTAIGVASSGLIAAATLTALDDLFPFPAHWWGWFFPVVAGVAAVVASVRAPSTKAPRPSASQSRQQ
jgi:hypothetical protein